MVRPHNIGLEILISSLLKKCSVL